MEAQFLPDIKGCLTKVKPKAEQGKQWGAEEWGSLLSNHSRLKKFKTFTLFLAAELGDYSPSRHSPGYVSEFRFHSAQTEEVEQAVEVAHGRLVGLVPSQAENRYLEKVKWLDMYGVDLHPVIGEDNIEYFLGLTPSGIIVLKNRNKVFETEVFISAKIDTHRPGWQLLLAADLEDLLQREILHAPSARQEQRREHVRV